MINLHRSSDIFDMNLIDIEPKMLDIKSRYDDKHIEKVHRYGNNYDLVPNVDYSNLYEFLKDCGLIRDYNFFVYNTGYPQFFRKKLMCHVGFYFLNQKKMHIAIGNVNLYHEIAHFADCNKNQSKEIDFGLFHRRVSQHMAEREFKAVAIQHTIEQFITGKCTDKTSSIKAKLGIYEGLSKNSDDGEYRQFMAPVDSNKLMQAFEEASKMSIDDIRNSIINNVKHLKDNNYLILFKCKVNLFLIYHCLRLINVS